MRSKPVARAIRLLSIVEKNSTGLRVTDMADQLRAPLRAVYRDLDVLQQLEVPLYTDKEGRESYWKIDIGTVVFGKSLLRDRDEEEVRGYRDALRLIHEQGAKLALSEATIKNCTVDARRHLGRGEL
jgi:predicted DNA-binding transcriptional regulator YafY